VQNGFNGDLVVLSADPLAAGANLSQIFVLYTIHNGEHRLSRVGKGVGDERTRLAELICRSS
jgi:hypothetical protein